MLKDKPIDISQTNMALFGTEIEKNIKKFAASGEPAWATAGKTEGLEAWRIENFQVKESAEAKSGVFYDGDSYIVLKTTKANDRFNWDVHFWLGTFTTADEAGTAAYKTVELDDFLDGYPVEHREVQEHESAKFHAYFPNGIQVLKGGVDSGFRHVESQTHRTRLLQIKGRLRNVTAREVQLHSSSLNAGDVFLLDNFHEVYVFVGSKAGIGEKTKGTQLSRALDDERGSKVTIHVISESDMNATDESTNQFWKLLGGRVSVIKLASDGGNDDLVDANHRLLKVSDETGTLEMTEVDYSRKSLSSNDVFIIDVGSEVFVWIGNGASQNERKSALICGQKYLNTHGKPAWTPLHRVVEGAENELLLGHLQ